MLEGCWLGHKWTCILAYRWCSVVGPQAAWFWANVIGCIVTTRNVAIVGDGENVCMLYTYAKKCEQVSECLYLVRCLLKMGKLINFKIGFSLYIY